MKRIFMAMVMVFLLICLLGGCSITDLMTPGEPEVIEPVAEAIATAKLIEVDEGLWSIEWSVVNIGDVNIELYILTFDVYYPIDAKDNVIVEVSGGKLDIGEFHEGTLNLLEYGAPDNPENVSVSWKLF